MRGYITHNYLRLLSGVLFLLIIVSCGKHEVSEKEGGYKGALQLQLHIDSTMLPPNEVVWKATRSLMNTENADVRYTIRAYKADKAGKFNTVEHCNVVFTKDRLTEDAVVRLQLEEGNYKFLVWADYVDEGSKEHKFYNTDNFEEVTYFGEYCGNTELRNVFRGNTETQIRKGTNNNVTVNLLRPLAKYKIITTDLVRFLHKEKTRLEKEQNENARNAPDCSISLDSYNVTFRYTQFVPCSFNLFVDNPVDAKTGFEFNSKITQINEHEAELGFDYVMLNDEENPMPELNLTITGQDGVMVANMNIKDIMLMRNRMTTIKGEFLTTNLPGGIIVNPDFDEDINVPLNY